MLATLLGPVLGGVLSTLCGVVAAFLIAGMGLVIVGIAVFAAKRYIDRGEVTYVTESG
jgi:hypothetical protein